MGQRSPLVPPSLEFMFGENVMRTSTVRVLLMAAEKSKEKLENKNQLLEQRLKEMMTEAKSNEHAFMGILTSTKGS